MFRGGTFSLGFLLLAVYLVLLGITTIWATVAIPALALGIIALLAGIFIFIGF